MKRQTRIRLLTMLVCFVLMFACTLSACKDAVPTPDPDKVDTCTTHVDKDGDGKCDKCGAEVPKTPTTCTVHADSDGDGKCDKCGADMPITSETFSYFGNTKLTEDKKVYLLNSTADGYNYDGDQLFLCQALQGLFARKNVTFYVDSHYMTNGTNVDMFYLEQAKENYCETYETISL